MRTVWSSSRDGSLVVTRASNFVSMREVSSESELVVADWSLPCLQRTIRNKMKIITKKHPVAARVVGDWSKSIGGGGTEQRGGGSWGFELCERGGSCNFQLPLRGGSPYFLLTTNETVDYTCYIKHSQLELLLKYSQICCARKYKGWQAAHLYGRGTLC